MVIVWIYAVFVMMNFRPCQSFPVKITTFRNHKSELHDSIISSSMDQRNERDIITVPRLCVILPSYNEQDRIERTLNEYSSYLRQEMNTKLSHVDMIVVNDGSTDQTGRVVNDYITSIKGQNPTRDEFFDIYLCHIRKNVGKGAAISSGINFVLQNNADDDSIIILVADADGSGDIRCLPDFILELHSLILRHGTDLKFWNNPALVVGQRVEAMTPSKARYITRWGFRTAVQLFSGITTSNIDTQCGFKLMTLPTAKNLYQDLLLQRWSHDVEVVYRAESLYNYPITSYPVNWTDRPGSKLVAETNNTQQYLLQIIQVSTVMLLEIIQMRWQYSVIKSSKDII